MNKTALGANLFAIAGSFVGSIITRCMLTGKIGKGDMICGVLAMVCLLVGGSVLYDQSEK